jgi:hypothetical protein
MPPESRGRPVDEALEKQLKKEATRRRVEMAHEQYLKVRHEFRVENRAGCRLSSRLINTIAQEYMVSKDQVKNGIRMKDKENLESPPPKRQRTSIPRAIGTNTLPVALVTPSPSDKKQKQGGRPSGSTNKSKMDRKKRKDAAMKKCFLKYKEERDKLDNKRIKKGLLESIINDAQEEFGTDLTLTKQAVIRAYDLGKYRGEYGPRPPLLMWKVTF